MNSFKAARNLFDDCERVGVELIRFRGVARTLALLNKDDNIPSWLLDELQAAIDHAQRAILHYRQQHELETRPQA